MPFSNIYICICVCVHVRNLYPHSTKMRVIKRILPETHVWYYILIYYKNSRAIQTDALSDKNIIPSAVDIFTCQVDGFHVCFCLNFHTQSTSNDPIYSGKPSIYLAMEFFKS